MSRVITGEATLRWPPPGAADGTVARILSLGSYLCDQLLASGLDGTESTIEEKPIGPASITVADPDGNVIPNQHV